MERLRRSNSELAAATEKMENELAALQLEIAKPLNELKTKFESEATALKQNLTDYQSLENINRLETELSNLNNPQMHQAESNAADQDQPPSTAPKASSLANIFLMISNFFRRLFGYEPINPQGSGATPVAEIPPGANVRGNNKSEPEAQTKEKSIEDLKQKISNLKSKLTREPMSGNDASEISKKIVEIQDKLRSNQEQLTVLNQENPDISKLLSDDQQESIRALKSQETGLMGALREQNDKIAAEGEKIQTLAADLETLKKEREDFNRQISANDAIISAQEQIIDTARKEIILLDTKIQENTKSIDEFESKSATSLALHEQNKEKLATNLERISQIESELPILIEEIQSYSKEQEEILQITEASNNLTQQLSVLKQSIHAQVTDLQSQDIEITRLRSQADQLLQKNKSEGYNLDRNSHLYMKSKKEEQQQNTISNENLVVQSNVGSPIKPAASNILGDRRQDPPPPPPRPTLNQNSQKNPVTELDQSISLSISKALNSTLGSIEISSPAATNKSATVIIETTEFVVEEPVGRTPPSDLQASKNTSEAPRYDRSNPPPPPTQPRPAYAQEKEINSSLAETVNPAAVSLEKPVDSVTLPPPPRPSTPAAESKSTADENKVQNFPISENNRRFELDIYTKTTLPISQDLQDTCTKNPKVILYFAEGNWNMIYGVNETNEPKKIKILFPPLKPALEAYKIGHDIKDIYTHLEGYFIKNGITLPTLGNATAVVASKPLKTDAANKDSIRLSNPPQQTSLLAQISSVNLKKTNRSATTQPDPAQPNSLADVYNKGLGRRIYIKDPDEDTDEDKLTVTILPKGIELTSEEKDLCKTTKTVFVHQKEDAQWVMTFAHVTDNIARLCHSPIENSEIIGQLNDEKIAKSNLKDRIQAIMKQNIFDNDIELPEPKKDLATSGVRTQPTKTQQFISAADGKKISRPSPPNQGKPSTPPPLPQPSKNSVAITAPIPSVAIEQTQTVTPIPVSKPRANPPPPKKPKTTNEFFVTKIPLTDESDPNERKPKFSELNLDEIRTSDQANNCFILYFIEKPNNSSSATLNLHKSASSYSQILCMD